MEQDRLAREDWIKVAYTAFEQGGISAVKADRLAKSLGVTRGSFYWHFKNVTELMQAVLVLWREEQTESVIAENETAGGTAHEKLRRLLDNCALDDGMFETGIRNLAASDAGIAAIVAEVDARRVAYLALLLEGCGKDREQAEALSPVVYSAWLGEYSGATLRSVEERKNNMATLFELITAP